ncbi:hypothetical protein H2198_010132 [Neophaeococcomyces mojaviensis]|uniref:Uncharacterized protein n=1 Tax=Neophaeococcomyces mojaviensis TaxID=3383035 RepID=A0ACC2ZSI1_9EURO|nr:hypothetical protein H2198_010132 [Knufia sp. JES_112]
MERIFALTPVPTIVLDESLHIIQISTSFCTRSDLDATACRDLHIYDFVRTKTPELNVHSLQHAIDKALTTKQKAFSTTVNSSVQKNNTTTTSTTTSWHFQVTPIFEGDKLLYILVEAPLEDNAPVDDHLTKEPYGDPRYTSETYRILINSVKDYAIFMIDKTGNVTTWNPGAALIKGYQQEDIIGKNFSIFYGEEDRKARKPQKELEICLREGKVEDEGWRYRKDGTRFWANVLIRPVHRGDKLYGFCKVTRDLTERKAAELRLISAFEEASKLKSTFLANMSHEIRTPMHGMLSALSLLMDTGLTPEQHELASIIQESGSVLLQIINNILDYSKLAAGSFTTVMDVINLPGVVYNVIKCNQASLKPNVTFDSRLDPKIPRTARGDPLRYRQILQNLVGNALKFTDSGSIQIHVTLVNNDETSYEVMTEVIDTGIGIPPNLTGSLFTPFTQLDNSSTKRYTGSGLGLSICKRLAELMGGTIGYRPHSALSGSIFWFIVKLSRLEVQTSSFPVRAAPNVDITRLAAGKQILLAEDNLINQTVMLKLLRKFGFEKVDVASNGEEAVRAVRQKPLTYSLILMDISMPVLDGIEATTEIRKSGLDIPIIAMTANALKTDEEAYLAKGLNDYVPKPVDRELLLRVLEKWLQRSISLA